METKHIVNRTFNLQLTTLSPVAINSGKELSPLSDYFVFDGMVYFVDAEKFQQLLLSDKDLLEAYENQVQETSMDGADNFLNDLFKDDGRLQSIAGLNSIPYTGDKTIILKEISKIAGSAYIPGSSIKGAIKNAVLYYWLTKTGGTFELKKFFTKEKVSFYKKSIEEIDKKQTLYKKERNNRKKLHGEINGIKRNILNELNRLAGDWEHKAFGINRNAIKQPSSNLKISDTNSISLKDNVEVSSLIRKSLRKDINDWILNNQEYIKPLTTLNFQIQIGISDLDWREFNYNSLLKEVLLKCTESPTPLFEILNHFSKAVANCQEDFKLDIPVEILNVNSHEAYLSLGSGKGIYKNTVLLAIKKHYDQNGFDFLNDFVPLIAKKNDKNEDFPNSVSHIDNNAMGWVKLSYH